MQTNKKHHLFAHYRAFFIVLLMILSGRLVAQDTQINITVAAGETFTLPVADDPTNSFSINWGDGNTDDNLTNDVSHLFQETGDYTLSVTGTFAGIDWDTFVTEGATEPYIFEYATVDPTISFEKGIYILNNLDYAGEYKFSVVWGDGSVTLNATESIFHEYPETGMWYEVKIYGSFPSITATMSGSWDLDRQHNFDLGSLEQNTTGGIGGQSIIIRQWGNNAWKDLSHMFSRSDVLAMHAPDVPNLENVSSLDYFTWISHSEEGANYYPNADGTVGDDPELLIPQRPDFDMEGWNIEHITSIAHAFSKPGPMFQFYHSDAPDYIGSLGPSIEPFIASWTVDQVTDFDYFMDENYAFDQDLSGWNPVSVTSSENWCADTRAWSTENFEATLLGWIDNPDYHYNQSLLHNIFDEINTYGRQICSDEAVRAAVKHAGLFADSPVLGDDGTPVNWAEDCREAVQFVHTVTAGEAITIPVITNATNDFTVMWGDKVVDLATDIDQTGDISHTYTEAGTYTIHIVGTFAGIDWDTFVTEGATEPYIFEYATVDPTVTLAKDIYILTNLDYAGEYKFSVVWGDGSVTLNATESIFHEYPENGMWYEVKIYGSFPSITATMAGAYALDSKHNFNYGILSDSGFGNVIGGQSIIIRQWGNNAWKELSNMFSRSDVLAMHAPDVPNLENVSSLDYFTWQSHTEDGGAFYYPEPDGSVSDDPELMIPQRPDFDMEGWNVEHITTMAHAFSKPGPIFQFYHDGAPDYIDRLGPSIEPFIASWTVDQVTDFDSFLEENYAFDQDLSGWNPVSVTSSENWCADTRAWSTENFEATLLGWIDNTDYHYNQSLLHNIFDGDFGGGGRQICSYEAVRASVKHAGLFGDSPVLGDDGTPVNWAEDCREGVQFVYTVTAGEAISLPVITDATNDFTVMWGDKVVDLATDIDQTGDISHTYTEAGTYTVHIVGHFSGMDWDRVTDEVYRVDAGDFVMTITVPAEGLTIKSPENSGYVLDTYDFDIYWGDGSYNYHVDGNGVTHTYPAAGEYQVRISGALPHFIAKHADLEDKLLSVDQWGSNAWKSMRSTFASCQHMHVLATDLPDLSQVTDFEATFQNCLALTGGISQWDVSHGKTFDVMLASSSLRESLADWDISQAESMYLFAAGVDFTTDQYDDMLMAWSQLDFARSVKLDISAQYCSQEAHAARQSVQEQINLTDQGRMYGCAPFITTWSFSEDMPTLTLYHSNGYDGAYDYEIDWGDGRIENYGAEDDEAAHTYGQAGTYDVSITGTYPHFDRSSLDQNENLIAVKQWGDIEWKSFADAFSLCTNLDIEAEDTPDLSQVSDFSYAFTECSSLTGGLKDWQFEQSSINLTHFLRGAVAFDEDLSGWDISKVGTMGIIFSSNSSGLPTAWSSDNVDATLIGWAKQDIIFSSLEIWDAEYCSYEAHLAVEQIRAKTRGNDVQITRSDCDQQFIMTFEVAPGQTLAIPTNLSHVYDYTIQWGDGTVDLNVTGDISHTYANTTTQPYQVRISGDFPAIYFNDSGDKDALISVDQWGNISWKTFLKAFWGCTNMEVGEFAGVPNLAHVTSMKRAFQSCNRLIGTSMSAWDVSTIDNMDHAFQNAWAFNADLTGWATHSLSRAVRTFKKASSFDQDLGGWDFSNLSNAEGMLDNSGLSTENYDNLISGLPQQSLTVNLELGANGLTYCESAGDRGFLIDVLGWQFTGDEPDCTGQQAARSATHQANQVENLEQQMKEVVIYPNPASEVLRVNTPADFEVVRIYNLSGILVKSTKASEINISTLKTGLYLLVIEFKDESEQVLKFVKE